MSTLQEPEFLEMLHNLEQVGAVYTLGFGCFAFL